MNGKPDWRWLHTMISFLQSQPAEWDFLLPSNWLTCEFIACLEALILSKKRRALKNPSFKEVTIAVATGFISKLPQILYKIISYR
jgi:hypothetical protein